MKKNIFKFLLLGLTLSVGFTSCREDEFVGQGNELGDGGKTIVRIADGPQKSIFLTAFSDTRKIDLFSIFKDVNSNAALNTTSTVTLVSAPDLITAYNTANPAGQVSLLPESIYTLAGNGVTKTATGYNVVYSPGEYVKDFSINLNGAAYDLSKKYAIALTIGSPGDGAAITNSTQKQILAIVSIKNKYDGVYTSVDGFIQRYTAPGVAEVGTLSGTMAGNPDLTATTVDANTIELTNLRWFTGATAISGIENLRVTVDPSSGAVTLKSLVNATLVATPGKVNKYDEATKTYTLNFDWNPVTTPRIVTNLVFKYKGARP